MWVLNVIGSFIFSVLFDVGVYENEYVCCWFICLFLESGKLLEEIVNELVKMSCDELLGFV